MHECLRIFWSTTDEERVTLRLVCVFSVDCFCWNLINVALRLILTSTPPPPPTPHTRTFKVYDESLARHAYKSQTRNGVSDLKIYEAVKHSFRSNKRILSFPLSGFWRFVTKVFIWCVAGQICY